MKSYKIGESQNLLNIQMIQASFLNYAQICEDILTGLNGVHTYEAERVIVFKNTTNKVAIHAVIRMDVEVNIKNKGATILNIENVKPTFYTLDNDYNTREVRAIFGKGGVEYDFEHYLTLGEWTRKIILDENQLELMLFHANQISDINRLYASTYIPFIDATERKRKESLANAA